MIQFRALNALLSVILYSGINCHAMEIVNPKSSAAPRKIMISMDHITEEHKITIDTFASIIGNKETKLDDYNDWIRVVVEESMKLCHEEDEDCEDGIYSGVIQGMRSAVALRDGESYVKEFKEYLPDNIDETSKDLIFAAVKILEQMDPVEGAIDHSFREITKLQDNSVLHSNANMNTVLNMGLIGAEQWYQVFNDSSHGLYQISTSNCKSRKSSRIEDSGILERKAFSEVIAANFLGAAYAVYAVEHYNLDSPLSNDTFNSETALMISFVGASLPVITTKVD